MSRSDSLERIVPEELDPGEATGDETLRLHQARYHFAARHLIGSRVLDLACGVGYGSVILAAARPEAAVVGADLSLEALRHAHRHYSAQRVSLVCGDGGGWCRQGCFDSIVSLETLEHVPDPGSLFGELASLLRPGGRLIASVPVTPSVDANPHHRTDFTERSFRALGASAGLTPVAELRQSQRYSPLVVARRQERRTRDLRRNLPGYYLRHPGSFLRRLVSLARDGFTNRYLTVVWERPVRSTPATANRARAE